MSLFQSFLKELQRRRVGRVAVAYAAAAFVTVEAADLFLPRLGLPDASVTITVLVAVAGFPLALAFAWFFDFKDGQLLRTATPRAELGRNARWALALTAGGALLAVAAGLGWWAWGRTPDPRIDRVAVLPMADLAGDPEQAFFVQGFHDRVLTELQQTGVPVIARTSVLEYAGTEKPLPAIAREMGVDAVVESSLLRFGDSLRIESRLVDGRTGDDLWQGSFSEDIRDIRTLYRELTRTIAGRISATLAPDRDSTETVERTVNPRAYEAYLRGIHHVERWTPSDLTTALAHFNRAISLDSLFPEAHLGVGQVWGTRAQIGLVDHAEARARSLPALERALQLAPDLAAAHAALGSLRFWGDWDWDEGIAAHRRSLALNPYSAETQMLHAHQLTIMGRWDDASERARRALDLDPLNPYVQMLFAMQRFMVGEHVETIRVLRRVFRENPGWGGGKAPLAGALRLSGHEEEALETWRDEYEIRGEPAVVAALQRGFREGGYETAYRRGAEAIAERFAEGGRVLPIDAAAFYMAAELPEQAIDWLERAVAIHDQNVPYIGALPTFEPLHDDPRFQTLLERLDLPLLRRSSP